MEIATVRQAKGMIEDSIRNLIVEFERVTGTELEKIEIIRTPMYTGYSENVGNLYVQAKVKL